MKIKNKFITGALLSIASLGVVGSVASTYAWYSYNTKDVLSYRGIASGNSENLQIRVTGTSDWKQSLKTDELVTDSVKSKHAGKTLQPVSFKEDIAKTDEIKDSDFVSLPTFGTNEYNAHGLKDSSGNYVFFETSIQLRCINPTNKSEFFEQEIYLSDLTIISENENEMSKAIRVHFHTDESTNYLVAPASATSGTTALSGKLDLNDDEKLDKGIPEGSGKYHIPYEWEEGNAEEIIYGADGCVEGHYGQDAVATFTNGIHDNGTGICLGKTKASGEPLQIQIIIFVDGWDAACVDKNLSSEDDYKVDFDLGMTFQCNAL